MIAKVIVEVDGAQTVLRPFEVEFLLGALRRDCRSETKMIGVDGYDFYHRTNAGHDRNLLQVLQPKSIGKNHLDKQIHIINPAEASANNGERLHEL